MESNQIIYRANLHWLLFLAPLALLITSFILPHFIPLLANFSWLLTLFSLIWIGITWVTYMVSSLTIKPNQVIIQTGFLIRQTIDLPLSKIESIDIKQSIFGTIFNYGSLAIVGTGGTPYFINFLANPLLCRRYIEQSMHS